MIIYKYGLDLLDGGREIDLPEGAEVVHVANQDGVPTIWIKLDDEKPNVLTRYFAVVGTGQHIAISDEAMIYHGAAMCGIFVWHVFEDITTGGRRK